MSARAHVGRGGPAFSSLHDGEVDAVVHAAVLGDRREDGLVVRRGVDREEAVGARGEALAHVGGDDAVAVRGRVDALEEGEIGRLRGLRLVERGEGLDDDVRVADDFFGVVELRGRGVVVELRVGEGAELGGRAARQWADQQRAMLVLRRTCMFLTLSLMVKASFAFNLPKFCGNTNLALGRFALGMMRPMGTTLHEPVRICLPSVKGTFWVRQKLIKLFFEVSEGT